MNQPADSGSFVPKGVEQILAAMTAEELLALMQGMLQVTFPGMVSIGERSLKVNLRTRPTLLDLDPVLPDEAQVTKAKGATKPTLLRQFASLSCGQQLGVLVVILLAVRLLDPPAEVRGYIDHVIALATATIWAIQKVTKS